MSKFCKATLVGISHIKRYCTVHSHQSWILTFELQVSLCWQFLNLQNKDSKCQQGNYFAIWIEVISLLVSFGFRKSIILDRRQRFCPVNQCFDLSKSVQPPFSFMPSVFTYSNDAYMAWEMCDYHEERVDVVASLRYNITAFWLYIHQKIRQESSQVFYGTCRWRA